MKQTDSSARIRYVVVRFQTPTPWLVSMGLWIVFFCFTIGFFSGAVFGAEVSESNVGFSLLMGLIIGVSLAACASSTLSLHRRKTSLKESRRLRRTAALKHQPAPFQNRLSHYVGIDVAEIKRETSPFRSRMPFWTSVQTVKTVPPKSGKRIREILMRIRSILGRTRD